LKIEAQEHLNENIKEKKRFNQKAGWNRNAGLRVQKIDLGDEKNTSASVDHLSSINYQNDNHLLSEYDDMFSMNKSPIFAQNNHSLSYIQNSKMVISDNGEKI